MPEEREEEQQEQEQKREPLFGKSTMIIIAVFAAINVGVIFAVFGSTIFGSSEDEEGVEPQKCVLEQTSMINLGRIEVSKPIDPMHKNLIQVSVNVSLLVPAERASFLEPLIKQNDAVFKELSREAFRNANPDDIATENVAGVKNTIQRRGNELLGEEGIAQVVFGDYRAY
jgi:flagellar basal body-associated protein FliL